MYNFTDSPFERMMKQRPPGYREPCLLYTSSRRSLTGKCWDGICRVNDNTYTKTLCYEDINYAVASADDQAAIFDGYCAFLNYFDNALPFQLSFVNHRTRPENRYAVNIQMCIRDRPWPDPPPGCAW